MKKLLFICACVATFCSCDNTKQYKCQCDNGYVYYNEQSTADDATVWCDTYDKPCPAGEQCVVKWDCALQ